MNISRQNLVCDTLRYCTQDVLANKASLTNGLTINQALGMGTLIGMFNMLASQGKTFEQNCQYLASVCLENNVTIDKTCVPDSWLPEFKKAGIIQ